ncbi:MAG: hypothetical protein Ta2A_10160 [Treponemataceae bacterium]|nr:MAG: hypothetical protein Ta2A_10160 [Treponemataceae bacterium]
METMQLVDEINRLPVFEKMLIVEKVIYSVRKEGQNTSMKAAVDALYDDYVNDKDLTAFTALDCEDFYETR